MLLRFQGLGVFVVVVLAVVASADVEDEAGSTREIRVDEDYGQEDCLEGEVFLTCGSECPEACYNLGMPRACGLRCKEGCFCDERLVRNPDGVCVRPDQCPPEVSPDN